MARRNKPRMRREDAFLGIHFDFHAGTDCTDIGKTLTAGMLEEMLTKIRPDYVQCDCKGHRGLSSYPTKVGHPAPGYTRDPLKIWRQATARHNVPLFMHYSGIWDTEAIRRHPDWAVLCADGTPDPDKTSVFSPYANELMIPQLLELHREWGVDGVWVDGDCWATVHDYRPEAVADFCREYGFAAAPRSAEEPGWQEFSEFCREGFRNYLRHYLETLHQTAPDLQITSNWAFSSFMPEPVTAPLKFLSGDYSLTDSYNAARLEGRCLALQGLPWDLMAWSFAGLWEDECRSTKSAVQLQQEAAAVLALGGGFQCYFQQNRDASIQSWQMDMYAEVAKFCRERQAVCHRSTPVPQVGLYYARESYYWTNARLFSPLDGHLLPLAGVLQCLLDGQQVVDVLMDHHVLANVSAYGLVVVPEWGRIASSVRERLVTYVRAGGKLLVIGPDAVGLFQKELGVESTPVEAQPRWLEHERHGRPSFSGVLTRAAQVRLGRGARAIGKLWTVNDRRGEAWPAASVRKLGRGLIAGVYFDFGRRYKEAAVAGLRDFLHHLCFALFPDRLVVVENPFVDVTLQQKDGRLIVHLINTAGPHADKRVFVFDAIPPVGPVRVILRDKPRRLTMNPASMRLNPKRVAGGWEVVVDELPIHVALVVE